MVAFEFRSSVSVLTFTAAASARSSSSGRTAAVPVCRSGEDAIRYNRLAAPTFQNKLGPSCASCAAGPRLRQRPAPALPRVHLPRCVLEAAHADILLLACARRRDLERVRVLDKPAIDHKRLRSQATNKITTCYSSNDENNRPVNHQQRRVALCALPSCTGRRRPTRSSGSGGGAGTHQTPSGRSCTPRSARPVIVLSPS